MKDNENFLQNLRQFLPSERISSDEQLPQIEASHIEVGYSNSRTCEIGLESNTGIPYISIVNLVSECTTTNTL